MAVCGCVYSGLRPSGRDPTFDRSDQQTLLYNRDLKLALAQPIFEGGRLFAREKAERARREQMLSLYEQTVQSTFRETRDALVAGIKTAQAQEVSLQRALAMRRSLELSRKQHARGYISIIDVLDIQRQARLDSIVALCRAMGGGWSESSLEFSTTSQVPDAAVTGANFEGPVP